MMQVAASEFEALLKRAARGAGHCIGHSEDFANAVLALHRAGEPGADLGLAELRKPVRQPTFANGVLHGDNAVTLAPSALDLAPVALTGDFSRDLLAGYLLTRPGFQQVEVSGTVHLRPGETTMAGRADPPFDVGEDTWTALIEMSQAMLVPTTAASQADAGSQLSDND